MQRGTAWMLVVAVAVVAVAAMLLRSAAPAEFDPEAMASIEARVERAGMSRDASEEIERQLILEAADYRRMTPAQLQRSMAVYERFAGADRVHVARWVSASITEFIGTLEPHQVEGVREPLRAMILEFWDQPQFSWELFTVARNLGLHTDPLIDEFAREAIASESIPAQTRGFIRRVMFETPDREER